MSEFDVHEFLREGEFVIHYRGPSVGDVKTGDHFTAVKADTAEPGQIVVLVDSEGDAVLAEYVPGMAIHGRVTGLMRRLA